MNKPLVSIIIPFFNTELYLEQTIRSALQQTWPHTELILVNDGSTDGSPAIAHQYANEQVKVFSQANRGASSARNTGLAEASGQYIQFLDADDLLSPDKIAGQLRLLESRPGKVGVCATVHFLDGQAADGLRPRHEWYAAGSDDPVDFLKKLYAGAEVLPGFGGMVPIHAWLTPRPVIDQAGPWNDQLSVDDDGEYFARVVLASKGIVYSPAGISYYRKYAHHGSLSAQNSKNNFESRVRALDLKYGYLKARDGATLVDRIFAKHYWWTGVLAYPKFKELSERCIAKARLMGYQGEKYVGGPAGHLLTGLLGWKAARLLSYYKNSGK